MSRARPSDAVVRAEAQPDRSRRRRGRLRAASEEPPARSQPVPGEPHAAPAPRRGWPPRDLTGLTVLVVDDDEGSLDYFSVALRVAGARVLTAASAREALRLVEERRPDVVVSDIAMPAHDGYWLVAELRRLPEPLGRTPVVATTAYGRTHPRERALAGGFVDHLAKPVDPAALCAAVARAAGRPG
jgi:CheY-like chemotaxis protein